jgi:hydrogenase expression/formation protein HypE
VTKAVEAACGFLGLDPMYIANEGKAVVVVSPETAEKALAVLRGFPESASAAVIGEVNARAEGLVLLRTRYGSERILSMLSGEPLPRIC